MIKNRNVQRGWRNLFIPAVDFTGARKLTTVMSASTLTAGGAPTLTSSVLTSTLSSLTLNEGTPNTLNAATIATTLDTLTLAAGAAATISSSTIATGVGSAVNATALTAEVNSLGFSGVSFLTTGGAGFAIRHYMPVPADFDVGHPIYARVYWTSGSTDTADTITWKLWHKAITPNTSALTATVDTALGTVIPQDTVPVATAWALCRTAPGVIAANTLTQGGFVELELEMDAFAVGLAEEKFAIGVEFLYQPLLSTDIGSKPLTALPANWV